MRCSAVAVAAALPALASAQQNPLEQYTAQFQQVVGQFGSYIPNPSYHDDAGAHEAKTGPMKLNVLTLNNWRDTIFEPVAADAKTPEEWWVLFTGRNKTCFGHCGKVEKAFNETAAKFADLPKTPHMGLVNCDYQPILCNSWSVTPGNLWAIDVLPDPSSINIYSRRLNLSTITTETLIKYNEQPNHEGFTLLDSWFHPFNGKVTELGLSVPFGYFLWAFGLIPNWLFMILVSFASRSMMGNRMAAQQPRRPPGGAPAPAAR